MATQPKPVFPETAAAVDPVTVEVIRGAMETLGHRAELDRFGNYEITLGS